MKIAMMAQAGSVHTTRWALGLANRGHRVWIISNDLFEFKSDRVETIVMPGHSSAAYFLNIRRVKHKLKEINPDLIHAHYATGYGLWGTLAGNKPLVVTVWGTDIEDALRGRFMIAPVVRRSLRRADYVTVPSEYLRNRVRAFEPAIGDKIVLIPFGVPIPEISAGNSAGRSGDAVNIIYAKNFRPDYAPDIALRAFAEAYAENKMLRLTMIGGGKMKELLLKMANEMNITEVVDISGWQDNETAQRLIKRADLMLIPSRKESFGVSALEAASYSIPVIASDTGGLPEIIENGVNGILVPPDDVTAFKKAILSLAADPEKRARMGVAGHKAAREKFDFENCLELMEDLYQELLTS